MKLLDDLLKSDSGKWQGKEICTYMALIAYHVMAFVNRSNITITEWVTAYCALHAALFVTNGLKNLLDNKAPNVTIASDKTSVTVS